MATWDGREIKLLQQNLGQEHNQGYYVVAQPAQATRRRLYHHQFYDASKLGNMNHECTPPSHAKSRSANGQTKGMINCGQPATWRGGGITRRGWSAGGAGLVDPDAGAAVARNAIAPGANSANGIGGRTPVDLHPGTIIGNGGGTGSRRAAGTDSLQEFHFWTKPPWPLETASRSDLDAPRSQARN